MAAIAETAQTLQEITEPDKVCVGRHGLMIKKGAVSGLLLPQVAIDNKWDRLRFLDETCRKAGLKAGAWKAADARLFIFTAQIFGGLLI